MSLIPREHDSVELLRDINAVIRKGMIGTILVKYSDREFEVEFVKEDGSNYEFEG